MIPNKSGIIACGPSRVYARMTYTYGMYELLIAIGKVMICID